MRSASRDCSFRRVGNYSDLSLTIDHAYVLAFSMMMLHTDAFNRHNKNKMTKVDYVRNTRMDGVDSLVLEVSREDERSDGRLSMTMSLSRHLSS